MKLLVSAEKLFVSLLETVGFALETGGFALETNSLADELLVSSDVTNSLMPTTYNKHTNNTNICYIYSIFIVLLRAIRNTIWHILVKYFR